MIYLAQPYSDISLEVMHDRYEAALAAVAHFTRKGQVIYSPIVHFHNVAIYHDLPRSFDFWQKINLQMLDMALQFYILQLPGWQNSIGLQAERTHAEKIGLSIVTMDDFRG